MKIQAFGSPFSHDCGKTPSNHEWVFGKTEASNVKCIVIRYAWRRLTACGYANRRWLSQIR